MSKAVTVSTSVDTEPTILNQKTELATKAVDLLMFSGQVGSMVQSMAAMAGIPEVSISLIFPTRKPGNMRPFLASVNSIISLALDDQVDLEEFTQRLAESIKTIRRIAEEEQ